MSRVNSKIRIRNNKNGYCLNLGNGQGWHIIGTKKIKPWIKKLASILELKPSGPNGYPKLIFIQKKSSKEVIDPIFRSQDNILKGLPKREWISYDLKALQIWFHNDIPNVICEMSPSKHYALDIIKMWQSLYPIYTGAQNFGGLPLHAALVEQNGIGILLAGQGEAGKSTCCRRLPLPWQALCDDETLIVRDDQKRYLVHPFPTWSDLLWKRSKRTWDVQHHLPLSALFFLEQGEIDKATPIGEGEAAIFINESATHVCQRIWRNLDKEEERKLRKLLFDNACQLAKAVPAFILRVSLSGRFWKEIEKALICSAKKENLYSENK